MKCSTCDRDMTKGRTTYTLNRNGYHLLVDDVPAWICTRCSEVHFEEEAVDTIQNTIIDIDVKVSRVRGDSINKDDILFYITKETMQHEAKQKIGRHLTEEELDIAKDGLDWGLMTGIDIVYDTILFEMIKEKEI